VLEVIAILAALQEPHLDRREVYCLAQNVYHEARGEPRVGQAAVANVTINRAHKRGKTVCEVVFEPSQFSWASSNPPRADQDAWHQAVEIAGMTYAGLIPDQTKGATYFYEFRKVKPAWASKYKVTRVIAKHKFMKEK
jgi:spore germination cell wall hydrolase CwlJ-like protein